MYVWTNRSTSSSAEIKVTMFEKLFPESYVNHIHAYKEIILATNQYWYLSL